MVSAIQTGSKNILFIGRSVQNSSVRLRHYNYFKLWEAQGYRPVFFSLESLSIKTIFCLIKEIKQADYIVIIRKTLKSYLLLLIKYFCKNKKLIFDYDDAIFADSKGHAKKRREQRFKKMIEAVDVVWAGNHYLKDHAAQYKNADKIFVIPTGLDFNKYNINKEAKNTDNSYTDLIWIGSSSTKKYLEPVINVLASIAEEINNLRLIIISDFSLNHDKLSIINIPWSEDTEAKYLVNADIGIAPMPDNIWTRGKCAFKIIQYMASGLPVLSSPVGMNQEVVINNQTGFLVESKQDWLESIKKLQNNSFRDKVSQNNREFIKNYFDMKVIFNKILFSIEDN